MATFYSFYPPNSAGSSNPSVGPNGSTIPGDSTLVGGENPSGNLEPLQTDSSGNLLVSLAAEPGAPLAVNLTEIGGAAVTEGQKTMANSLPIVIASDQSAVPVSATSLPLPTGAATSANQTNASQKTQIVDGSGNVIASTSNALNVQVENFPATQPVSGTVAVTQSTTPWVVGQATASALNATVAQGTASNLLSQVSQPTASNLNATVVQGTASNLNATVVQGTASSLNATVIGAGTAGTANAGVLTIQGIASMTPVQVSQATASNLNAAVVGVGTAGTPSGGVVSIQGVASGTVVPISGTVTTSATNSASSALTSVAGSASTTSLLASNTSRKGAYFFNDSTAILYLAFASTASTTAYTVQLTSNAFYEMPNPTIYTGAISGIWSSATGNVRITELS